MCFPFDYDETTSSKEPIAFSALIKKYATAAQAFLMSTLSITYSTKSLSRDCNAPAIDAYMDHSIPDAINKWISLDFERGQQAGVSPGIFDNLHTGAGRNLFGLSTIIAG